MLRWLMDISHMESVKTPLWQQEMHMARALGHAAFGEIEPALSEFEAAYEKGWRWLMGGKIAGNFHGDYGWLEDNPALDSIREEPRFIAILDKIKADNARMLAELNAGLSLEDIMDEGAE